jgi:hypothetical protein
MADFPDLTVTVGIKNATFTAKEIISIDILEGKGCGAKEVNCSDHTKVMLLEPRDDGHRDENLKILKQKLSEALDQQVT